MDSISHVRSRDKSTNTPDPPDADEVRRQLRGRWPELYQHELGDEHSVQSGEHVFYCPFHPDRDSDKPNLWVNPEDGQWYCHGRCKEGGDGFELIKRRRNASFPEAIRIIADIFNLSDPAPKRNGSGKWADPVAIHRYDDSEGNAYLAKKKFPKGHKPAFLICHYDENGTLKNGQNRREAILYRLPEVMRAVDESRRVVIVEGEKDADTLASHGIVATSNPHGAGTWNRVNDDPLTGAHVAILPDNDEPGHDHARDVARRLYDKAASIRVVSLGDNRNGADVSDYLDIGGDIESVKSAIGDTPEWEPDADDLAFIESLRDADESQPQGSPDTDTANAERFKDQHGDVVAHVREWGWLVFDGQRWNPDNLHLIHKKATETALSIYGEAGQEPDPDKRKRLSKWARQSENLNRIKPMIELAQHHVRQRPEHFDADATDSLLNVENGTVDLTTGQLREHRKADRITKFAPVTYDPAANADEWRAFLDHIFQGDDDLIRYVQKAMGYAMTADVSEQCILILHGSGANGKSTLVNVLMDILGDYARHADPSTFTVNRKDNIPSDVARLAGARFVSAEETSGGQRLNESRVKQMTGGDRITARFLNKNEFEFTAKFKLVLSTNHKPSITGDDHAIWRRIKLIPFNVQIPEAAQDKDMKRRLVADEASGILNWLIEGCMMWQVEGLDEPDAVRNATAEYRDEQDVLGDFISEYCVESDDARATSADLYKTYLQWAEENGIPDRQRMSKIVFSRVLKERGYEKIRVKDRQAFQGIGLAADKTLELGGSDDT